MTTSNFAGKHKPEEFFAKNLRKDMEVFERFVVMSEPRIKNGKHGRYIVMSIGDCSGDLSVYFWGVPESEIDSIKNFFDVGRVYAINGRVGEYDGRRKIDVNFEAFKKHCFLCEADDFFAAEMSTVKHVPGIDTMIEYIQNTIASFTNPTLKGICVLFFGDPTFVEKFKSGVGGRRRHHNRIGGLVEHTAAMLRLAEIVCELNPKLNRELLLAGVILHDIGKLYDYEIGLAIGMTRDHNYELASHMVMAHHMILERVFTAQLAIDEEILKRLVHLIFSHHGAKENGAGSAISPFLPEAVALSHIDSLDAKVNECLIRDDVVLTEF